MKNLFFSTIIILFTTVIFANCGNDSNDNEQIIEVCDSFSCQYFTWHFPDAMKFADDNGKLWLQFMSSNVHNADLEVIDSTTVMPQFSISDINVYGDSAIAVAELSNVILMDTLGKRAHFNEKARRTIILKKTDDTWKVHGIAR